MTWCAYYSINGEIVKFCSSKNKWVDLPQSGLIILVRDKELIVGQNYYSELDNYQSHDPNIKRGKAIDDKIYHPLYDKVRDGLRSH